MKRTLYLIMTAMCLAGCGGHFISDKAVRSSVEQRFEERKAIFTEGDLYAIFDSDMTTAEREAMMFLYSSMSSTDMGDYSGEFYLANVRASLKAQKEMAWGKDVPEEIFRHFVLPVRVNNETLDSFRTEYYDTLKERVAGLSMHDAALEVNHWCHEKVSYIPSDSRTSSPMATMLTAEGRCGEESTFAAAAMRAVGIPARQVYTPRWAHTDDNHAWIEVWTDGKWSFMGACEPEPELNIAWFNQPAARALLMHTRVFGDYHGTEDVIQRTECFTEINVVENYAPVRNNVITVQDTEGKAVEGATVEFKIYNYGEYCTVVTLKSDSKGQASLHTGLGYLMIWASKGGKFGFGRLSSESLTITLNHSDGDAFCIEEDITPPDEGNIPFNVTEEAVALNQVRLAHEDSIRNAYKATFFQGGGNKADDLLAASKGNWRDIKKFLDEVAADDMPRALALLGSISAKDLRDTRCEVLADALNTTPKADLTDNYVNYVLCPRIADEFIQPYKGAIREALSPAIGNEPSVAALVEWTKANIRQRDDLNPRKVQSTPAGVLRCRVADAKSRDIFFVAACRAFNIPARIDILTGKVQYLADGAWNDVMLEGEQAVKQPRMGYLRLHYDAAGNKALPNPEYYRHFTISRIENGRCRLLEFDGSDDSELGAGISAHTFSRPFALEEGNYLLTTGSRMASGKSLSRAVSFTISEGQVSNIDLIMRKSQEDVSVVGFMDAEKLYMPEGAAEATSILSTTGRGYFLLAVIGKNDEPSNHALRDLENATAALNGWGRPIVLLSPSADGIGKIKPHTAGIAKAFYGSDINGEVMKMLTEGCNATAATLPVITICDSFGRVVYFSQGYNTSTASQLTNVISKI